MSHIHGNDQIAGLYMKSQEALVALKVELQKSRTELARVTNDALTLRDQNRRLLDDQEQLTLARRDTEGKLRFRMRQVMELEQERTSYSSTQEELTSRVNDMQNRMSEMSKELNETKTEMKVMEVRNQFLEEKVHEAASSGVSIEAYRTLEAEMGSLRSTVKDMTELNRMQEKDLHAANEKARKASEKADKLASEATAAKQAAAHAIKLSTSVHHVHPAHHGDPARHGHPDSAKKNTEERPVHHRTPESPQSHDDASVRSSSLPKTAASPKAEPTLQAPSPMSEREATERPPRPPSLDTKFAMASGEKAAAKESIAPKKPAPTAVKPAAKLVAAATIKGTDKKARVAAKPAAAAPKGTKAPGTAKPKTKVKTKKQDAPKIRVEKEELSSPVGSEFSQFSFDDSITSAALKETILEPPKAKTATKPAKKPAAKKPATVTAAAKNKKSTTK